MSLICDGIDTNTHERILKRREMNHFDMDFLKLLVIDLYCSQAGN